MNETLAKDSKNIISDHNPMGTDGFELIEFTSAGEYEFGELFEKLGFTLTAHHKTRNVQLFRQDDVNFIVNEEHRGFAHKFANKHGPSVCAMGFRVADAKHAYERAISLGAKPMDEASGLEVHVPAIEGIGGIPIYLVDKLGASAIYETDFIHISSEEIKVIDPVGLLDIDHLTHNVYRGNMDKWAAFYEKLFNFKEIKYFDIEGSLTGLRSRAMTSPCGKIKIPINESEDDKSQIEEYLKEYNGEGVQHIAMATENIYHTVDILRSNGIEFMPSPPKSYYDDVEKRIPKHGEDIARLAERGILIDGAPTESGGILLQIFTGTVIGPIFFEIIERKGDEGFGEGNFKALFESIERDQIKRGVL